MACCRVGDVRGVGLHGPCRSVGKANHGHKQGTCSQARHAGLDVVLAIGVSYAKGQGRPSVGAGVMVRMTCWSWVLHGMPVRVSQGT